MKVISHDLPKFTELEIYPLADVHLGDPLLDRKRLNQFMKEVQAEPNRYVIVNGDILNWASRNSVSDIYSEEISPNEQIDLAVDLLEPIREKILVIVDGNHEQRAYKSEGISPMYQVAKRLDIFDVYSPGAYLLFISFGKSQGRDCRKMIYTLYGRHRTSGGKRPGGKANALEDMSMIIDADVYLVSHSHLPLGMKKSFFRCDYRNRKVTQVDKLFVNSNAFLKYGGYAENYGYHPTSTQYPKIILDGVKRDSKILL